MFTEYKTNKSVLLKERFFCGIHSLLATWRIHHFYKHHLEQAVVYSKIDIPFLIKGIWVAIDIRYWKY